MKLTMKHRYFLAGIFVIILGAIVVTAMITGTRHVQGDVLVTINTHKMTLQEAINNKYLNTGGPSPTASITTSVLAGHDASTIWVSVDGVEGTLQSALDSGDLCSSTPPTSYTNPKPNPGHYASEIEVGGKNLQDAIDSGDFCVVTSYKYSGLSACSACNPSCGPGTCTRTKTCGKYENDVFVVNVDCSFCGGVCSTIENCNAGSCQQTFTNPTMLGRLLSVRASFATTCGCDYYSHLWVSTSTATGTANAFCSSKGLSYVSYTQSPTGPPLQTVWQYKLNSWCACPNQCFNQHTCETFASILASNYFLKL